MNKQNKLIGLIGLLILALSHNLQAQDRAYAQKVIDTLSSADYHGRGYVFKGDYKAAEFIRKEMKDAGLESFASGDDDYFHDFKLAVNTFPGDLEVSVNDVTLTNGRDYIVHQNSNGLNGSFSTFYVSAKDLENNRLFKQLRRTKCKGEVLVIDTIPKGSKLAAQRKHILLGEFHGKALITIEKKLTWGVGRNVTNFGGINMKAGVLDIDEIKSSPATVSFNIEQEFVKDYESQNVCGMTKGSVRPDSFVFFTAHYDHLGRMGKDVYIPGANDNASGTAMMLDMARYFAKNPPKYSLVFIGFAGEEAGLVGSFNFVREMGGFIDPKKIRFVINMDLMGSGEKGIMAVNGKVFTEEFELLKSINDKNKHLPIVKSRGKAANSDHYFFTEAGVPAFFFYLMGEYSYYHEVDDSAENLRLSEYYDRSFLLIRDFLSALQGG